MLRRISTLSQVPNASTIDPLYASARAAALLSIDTLLRPCSKEDKCEFANCPKKTRPPEGWWGGFHLLAMGELAEWRETQRIRARSLHKLAGVRDYEGTIGGFSS
jgi:hypothetical protein